MHVKYPKERDKRQLRKKAENAHKQENTTVSLPLFKH